jgi:hypothetical protein
MKELNESYTVKLFDRNMRLRKTINDPVVVSENGVNKIQIPKTKCRYIQIVTTVSGEHGLEWKASHDATISMKDDNEN